MQYLTTEIISYLDTLKNNIRKTTGQYLTDQQAIQYAIETAATKPINTQNIKTTSTSCPWQHARG